MTRWAPQLPSAAAACCSKCRLGAGQSQLLESPGRRSGEGWSQGWRTPKNVDSRASLLPLAALGPVCRPRGLPPGKAALAPAFPHRWLLGIYVQPQQVWLLREGQAVLCSLPPHGASYSGHWSLLCDRILQDLCESTSCATAASGP